MTETTSDERHHGSFLFDSHDYHPIQEYIIDASIEEHTSALPTFVLEVTWPRVVLIYLPESHLCVDIVNTYLQVARYIRKHSPRIPVEFWALNCKVYPLSCDELHIKAVPSLLGYPGGEIGPKSIKRTHDNKIDMGSLLTAIDVVLPDANIEKHMNDDDEDIDINEIMSKHHHNTNKQQGFVLEEAEENEEEKDAQHRLKKQEQIIVNQSDEDMKNILHPRSASAMIDVCSDAAASFLKSLDSSIKKDSKTLKTIQYNKYQLEALREFLDLLHWTLPSRDMASLHNLVNDLRQSFLSIVVSPDEIVKVLTSHDYYDNIELQSWSSSCSSGPSSNNDGGYACGFWKLLHMLSIGIVEQHTKVMGDLDRIVVSHTVHVIRNYIKEFGFASNTLEQKYIIKEYDDCMVTSSCRSNLGIDENDIDNGYKSSSHGFFYFSFGGSKKQHHIIPVPTDPSWKNLAIWLWRVHNGYCTTPIKRKIIQEQDHQLWPTRKSCAKCYNDDSKFSFLLKNRHNTEENDGIITVPHNVLIDKTNGVVWNIDTVYHYLRHTYWPHGLQSPRLVVLDRTDHHAGKHIHHFFFRGGIFRKIGSMIELGCYIFLLYVALKYIFLYIKPKHGRQRRRRRRKKHHQSTSNSISTSGSQRKKKDTSNDNDDEDEENLYGIDDFLADSSPSAIIMSTEKRLLSSGHILSRQSAAARRLKKKKHRIRSFLDD